MVLEGDAGRWPTTACDFAATGLPGGSHGLWYLEAVSRDLTSSASQCLRLYLNTAHPDINELLNQPDSPQATIVQRALRYDTYRQLLTIAIADDEFDDRAVYDRGSLGDLLISVMRILAPGHTIEQLRTDHRHRSAEIDAETMSRAWGVDN